MYKSGVMPDEVTYSAVLDVYAKLGKIEEERVREIDDMEGVFKVSIGRGIKPDDRLCGCLLSAVSFCDDIEDANKVLACLGQANPKLVVFIGLMREEGNQFWDIKGRVARLYLQMHKL